MNLADLRRTLGVDADAAAGIDAYGGSGGVGGGSAGGHEGDDDGLCGADGKARQRRLSMERMDLLKVRLPLLFLFG